MIVIIALYEKVLTSKVIYCTIPTVAFREIKKRGMGMNKKIGVVVKEQEYLNRLHKAWENYYQDDFLLLCATTCEELKKQIKLESLTCILAEEDYKMELQTSKVPVMFLTEVSLAEGMENLNRIYKYQPISQIYLQVKKWLCQNIKQPLDISSEGKLTYKYGNRELLNEMDLTILNNISIDLVPIRDIGAEFLEYDLQGLVTLEKVCRKELETKKAFQVISQICSILVSLEEYLLNPTNILLQMNHIYMQCETGNMKLLYVPIKYQMDAQALVSNLNIIVQNILQCTSHSSKIQSGKLGVENPCTAVFSNIQMAAEQTRKKNRDKLHTETTLLVEQGRYPYLIRKNTGERIWINRNQFKIGKDRRMVDYCIVDNPAISKNHADITMQNGNCYVVDHHSLNATMLNGKIIPPEKWVQIHNEDCLIFANEKFCFYRNDDRGKE